MKTILFVCTGNVCRSPMAEGILRQAVQGRGNYRVISAGLGAMEGQPPSAYAVQAVRELGIDISSQRSRMLTPELVQDADFIFGMTTSFSLTPGGPRLRGDASTAAAITCSPLCGCGFCRLRSGPPSGPTFRADDLPDKLRAQAGSYLRRRTKSHDHAKTA